MRTLRGVLVGAIAVVLSSAGLTAPAAAADATPPSAPYTALILYIEGGSYDMDGSFSYESSRTTLTATEQNANGHELVMRATYGSHWHDLDVTAPIGTRFTAGQSYPTERNLYVPQTTTVLNLDGDGRYCGSPGTLNVLEANYDDATGELTAFAATFSVPCAGGTAKGEIRFQSSIGYRATDTWDYPPPLGQQPVGMEGTAQDATVYVDGTEPTTFGDASLSGANPDAFQITGNTCSGNTLSYGQTCTLTIKAKASALGDQSAMLTLLDNSFAGRVVRPLSLTGYDPRDATASPSYFQFGHVAAYYVSAPQTVTLTGAEDVPITFGQASITGTNAAYFKITNDGCSHQTLEKGQTCLITAATRPGPDATPGGATVVLPDDSVAGSTQIPLVVAVYKGDRGTYFPISPYRVLDTRSGVGGPAGMVGSGGVVHLRVRGAGAPYDASTVVLNVTVTGAASSGYVTVYPDGVTRPTASSVNFVKGWTGANSVTVRVGMNGRVAFYVAGGPTHVIADIYGYYSQGDPWYAGDVGGEYHPLAQPVRLTDTRTWGHGVVPAGSYINAVASWNSTVNPHVQAFAVNITATAPVGPGYLTAWNGSDGWMPRTSTLNYTKGATVSNFAVVPAKPCVDCGSTASGLPSIGVYTANGAHIIVDIVGFYDDGWLPGGGLRLNPVVPTRIVDTRGGLGSPSRLGPATTATITTPDSLADVDTVALATNVTAVQPTTSTYLTVWPAGIDGVDRPGTSNLNPTAGSVVPNAVQTMIGPDGQFNIYNAGGYCDVVVDVVGTFQMYPPATPSDWGGSVMSPAATNDSLVTPTAHSPTRAKRL